MNKLFEDISSIEKRAIINIYSRKIKKNKSLNSYNFFMKENNEKKRSLTPIFYNNDNMDNHFIDNKTNKLAFKHYKKISLMFEDLNKSNYYKNNNKEKKKAKINMNKYSGNENNNKEDKNFSNICNCTFNNYLKNIN